MLCQLHTALYLCFCEFNINYNIFCVGVSVRSFECFFECQVNCDDCLFVYTVLAVDFCLKTTTFHLSMQGVNHL